MAGLLLLNAVFPLVATAYADREITTAVTTPNETPDPDESSQPDADARTSGLGIRPLPLLSDQTREAWRSDPAVALEAAQTAFFGDQWDTAWTMATTINQGKAAQGSISKVCVFCNNDLNAFLDQRLTVLGAQAETTAIDLIGVFLLQSAQYRLDGFNTTPQSLNLDAPWPREILAYALADRLVAHASTCDSQLTLGFALTLALPAESTGTSATDYAAWEIYDQPTTTWADAAEATLTRAVKTCSADPTAAVSLIDFRLQQLNIDRAWENENVDSQLWLFPATWEPVLAQADRLAEDNANNPASHAARGDVYRVVAKLLSDLGSRPFVVRSYRDTALAAYEQAARLSRSPSITISAAVLQTDSGNAEAAVAALELIADYVPTEDRAAYFHVLAEAEAHAHDYAAAAADEDQAIENLSSSLASLTHTGLGKFSFDPITLTANHGALAVALMQGGGHGGPSLAASNGFVPQWRPAQGVGYSIHSTYSRNYESCLNEYTSLASGTWSNDLGQSQDWLQNMYRYYDDPPAAEATVRAWIADDPEAPWAWERLGEILFLQERWADSADASEKAHGSYYGAGYKNDLEYPYLSYAKLQSVAMTGIGWTYLRSYAATLKAAGSNNGMPIEWGPERRWSRQLQASDALARQDYESALSLSVEAMGLTARATETSSLTGGDTPDYSADTQLGVEAQIASTAALKLGRSSEAVDYAQLALKTDPANPLFMESLAEAQRASGIEPTPGAETSENSGKPDEPDEPDTRDSMIAFYQAALDTDPSLFSSWNNIGVLLAQIGQVDAARQAFRQSITVLPDYALGWFNLGTLESAQPGIRSFLLAEGALGRATRLDRSL
ncbi:MAG: tetratricopeptide repeat protein, partial [Propionibacteriaceae bacterium]|nr:tetratricopeptide repeat protein [Propionibacteriaceae bacterium]